MFTFQRSPTRDLAPGTWWPLQWGDKLKARIACPKCGRGCVLPHEVAADGTVTPSVVCAYTGRVECPHEQCDFHDTARLADWSTST